MKRICNLLPGEKIMYQWYWYDVKKIEKGKIYLTRVDRSIRKIIAAASKEYVQYEHVS